MGAIFCTAWLAASGGVLAADASNDVTRVIERVEKECREARIPMIGPAKARRLAELVREAKPERVVECGTAVGYSGLWIARELQKLGRGHLITVEISPERARQAEANFREAGLLDYITIRVGDARQVVKDIEGPIDFLFIDCGYSNYQPVLEAAEAKLAPGAIIVADNAGIGAAGMKDYLDRVRSEYRSRTEWFDLDLPWAKRDAMEISVVPGRTR